jgi:argininosuccinate lyase
VPTRPVWGNRFDAAPADEAIAFTRSTADRRLIVHDLRATRAHVNGLHRAGLLTDDDRERLVAAIEDLLVEARTGRFPFQESDEDVHVAVERILTARLGELGARIHAGRSRNDLVVTDLRLWVRDAANELAMLARRLARTLGARAEHHATDVLPGYTHLQRGQPVSLAHHLLAHAFPFARDAERLERASRATDVSALGAGALAGSTLSLDPRQTATDVGMAGAFENSMDAVSDRDFALEFLAACLSTAIHLSRLAEDLVLWSTEEFGFARPADAYATGSSMMPQKRNPDVAELARAQAGRVLGDLVTLATVLKGLPLAYDRDLQEDKPAVFDAYDSLAPALDAITGMVATLEFDTERMRAACADGFLVATDVAERLVAAGVPFRTAHARVAALVRALEAEGRTFADLKPEEWVESLPELDADSQALLAEPSLDRRVTAGGPSSDSVRAQLALLRERIG